MRFEIRVLPDYFEAFTVPAPEKENRQSPESNYVLRRGSSKSLISPIPTPPSQHYSIIFAFEISNKRELVLVLLPVLVQLLALVLVLHSTITNTIQLSPRLRFQTKGLRTRDWRLQ